MEQSRILEWNKKDNAALSLWCQAEQEWTEMLQNPEVMKQFLMTKRNENGVIMGIVTKRAETFLTIPN